MLSRLATRSLQEARPVVLVRATSTTAVRAAEERDEVNFPRPVRPVDPGKVRLGFIPEEWFQFFYPKTGVTGPYVFGVGLTTYLCSKEIYVMEHEYYSGLSLLVMAVFAVKKFGPSIGQSLDKEIDAIENDWRSYRDESIQGLKDTVEQEKAAQASAQGESMLFDAKRENVALQLEAAYRERLATVHAEVKKKLDYQLETANVKTRLQQKHMVDWIVSNVKSSITPAQEAASLKQCIADLKGLAPKVA
ncbi:hypothetical protein Pmani_007641 [Petrolisthes manimaculis]|uniref:ATP synthase subunit b n=1 Tax=Petrolisthes manimaculis TaxID=1843537 RepID=A0AAE1Q7X5_9EUCA|nr:hypothetical protein Pmani_007641 [Petrolisthes manimaculis]